MLQEGLVDGGAACVCMHVVEVREGCQGLLRERCMLVVRGGQGLLRERCMLHDGGEARRGVRMRARS